MSASGTWPRLAVMTCVVPWCRHRDIVTSYIDAQLKAVVHHRAMHPRRTARALARSRARRQR